LLITRRGVISPEAMTHTSPDIISPPLSSFLSLLPPFPRLSGDKSSNILWNYTGRKCGERRNLKVLYFTSMKATAMNPISEAHAFSKALSPRFHCSIIVTYWKCANHYAWTMLQNSDFLVSMSKNNYLHYNYDDLPVHLKGRLQFDDRGFLHFNTMSKTVIRYLTLTFIYYTKFASPCMPVVAPDSTCCGA